MIPAPRFRQWIGDFANSFVDGFPTIEQFKKGQLARLRLDDEFVAFLAHDGVFARKFELARNLHRLVATVAEKLDVTFTSHGICLSICHAGSASLANGA